MILDDRMPTVQVGIQLFPPILLSLLWFPKNQEWNLGMNLLPYFVIEYESQKIADKK